jgi:hypothetical protein
MILVNILTEKMLTQNTDILGVSRYNVERRYVDFYNVKRRNVEHPECQLLQCRAPECQVQLNVEC